MTPATLGFAIWPYVAIAIFAIGHLWRWRYDQFGWTTRTTQLLEHTVLRAASPLFHLGALLAIAGHAIGLLIPASWTAALGIPEHLYHAFATVGGVIAGVLVCAGLVLLLVRRLLLSTRIRLITTPGDWVLYALLAATIAIGTIMTFAKNVVGPGYDYRETVSIWFRSLFTLQPDVALMATAPLDYQLHVLLAFALIAIWPFTRLVHVWSAPLGYLARPYVVYRSTPRPAQAGAATAAGAPPARAGEVGQGAGPRR